MQKFSTFFSLLIGAFLTFLRGKSILINRYFFFLTSSLKSYYFLLFLVPYLFFAVFAGKYFFCIRVNTVSERKLSYTLSFFVSFQNITRENVYLTFGHLVSLCRRQARARQFRARQSNAVVRLIK